MKIIPVHSNRAQIVQVWPEISKAAKELREFATKGPFSGEHTGCYALHHAQVEEKPFNFFALSEEGSKQTGFPHWCIINPEIVLKTHEFRPFEGCMSYPHKKQKKVDRFLDLTVRFQYPRFTITGYKLADFEGELHGLEAHIFQHEYDHGQGKTIFS